MIEHVQGDIAAIEAQIVREQHVPIGTMPPM
jgi:hypothetical protein